MAKVGRKPTLPPAKRGRPPGKQRQLCSLECRLRAKLLYQQSGGNASPRDISAQLHAEGFDPAPSPTDVSKWKNGSDEWSRPIHAPAAAEISEDLRQAVQLRVPDDLDRIERSSLAFEMLTQHCAMWLDKQVENVKVETPEQFAVMSQSLRDMAETHLAITRALVDIRQLRSSSLTGIGQVIPPDRGAPGEDAMGRVISNFGA